MELSPGCPTKILTREKYRIYTEPRFLRCDEGRAMLTNDLMFGHADVPEEWMYEYFEIINEIEL